MKTFTKLTTEIQNLPDGKTLEEMSFKGIWDGVQRGLKALAKAKGQNPQASGLIDAIIKNCQSNLDTKDIDVLMVMEEFLNNSLAYVNSTTK